MGRGDGAVVALAYLAGTVISIQMVMLREWYLPMLVVHSALASYLLMSMDRLTRSATRGASWYSPGSAIVGVLVYWFVVSMWNFADVGVLSAAKPVVVNGCLNLVLGFVLVVGLQRVSVSDRLATGSLVVQVVTAVITSSVFLSADYTPVGLRALFQGDNNLYQSLSGYMLRLAVAGLAVVEITKSRGRGHMFILAVANTVFAFASLAAGSKKEPILFFLIAIVFLFKACRNSRRAQLTLFISLAALTSYGLGAMAEIGFIEGVQRSFGSRISILMTEFGPQLERGWLFGDPFGYERLGTIYAHSFLLSMSAGLGVPATAVFAGATFILFMRAIRSSLWGLTLVFASIFALANLATHFDWFVVWFGIGILAALSAGGRTPHETATPVPTRILPTHHDRALPCEPM